MIDVLFVSMPFGPLMSPSLGLSLLQPLASARGLTCRVEYFTLPFAERIGDELYSKITSQNRAMSRAFVGEWIFSHALFDWDAAHDERYLAEVLLTPPSWLGRNPTRPPSRGEVRAILEARDAVRAFVDWCAERIVDAQPRIVGFTSVFQQHLASLALARRVKALSPGTYTVMAQVASERLGLPVEKMEVRLGDTQLPSGPISGGFERFPYSYPGRLSRRNLRQARCAWRVSPSSAIRSAAPRPCRRRGAREY